MTIFRDGKRGWQKTRRRIANQFGVTILAKLWVRSKRLKELRASYLQRTLLPTTRKCRPLRDGQIRVLQIKPGHSMSTIECTFKYLDLESPGDYAALSYTWGQIAPSIPILVDGKVSLISENLYLALLHLRTRGVRALWVDALCIMQDDLAERASQVSQMKDVYEKAQIVLIWLGDSNELSERAFDEFHGLVEHLDWDEAVPIEFFSRAEMARHHQRWRAISEILYRPWFRRVWVIQEALSARQAMMICGKDLLELNLFLKLINSMARAGVLRDVMSYHPNRHEMLEGPMKAALEQIEFLVKAKFQVTNYLTLRRFEPTLLNFLAETRWAEATNPMDKVYGILSLARDARKLGHRESEEDEGSDLIPFKVDYTLSKADVFVNTTKAIIYTTRSLDALLFARYESNSTDGLPSWVPDWASKKPNAVVDHVYVSSISDDEEKYWRPDRKRPEGSYVSNHMHHQITQHCRPSVSFGKGNILTVKGIHFDTIIVVSNQVHPQDHNVHSADPQCQNDTGSLDLMQQHLEKITRWAEDCVQCTSQCLPYPTGQSPWKSLWKILHGGPATEDSLIPESDEKLLRVFYRAQSAHANIKKQILATQSNKSDDSLSDVASAAALSYFVDSLSRLPKMSVTCASRRFATTQKKYMGLVPEGAKVGDLVCFVYGSEMPFILRRCEAEKFHFVGHGKFEGLGFDDAVVASSSVLKRGQKMPKDPHFLTFENRRRTVLTVLKKTRFFDLV